MISKEKYIVLDDEDNVEYVIKVKTDRPKVTYKMFRSNSKQWTSQCRGEKLFTIVDADMNMSIKMHDNKFKDHQYHQTMELRILLNFVNSRTSMPDDYKVVKA